MTVPFNKIKANGMLSHIRQEIIKYILISNKADRSLYLENIKKICLRMVPACGAVGSNGYFETEFIEMAKSLNPDNGAKHYFVFSAVWGADNRHMSYSVWNRYTGTIPFMVRDMHTGFCEAVHAA